MNVYDFDGTIYDGDSTLDFYFFCLRRDFRIIIKLPRQIKGFILHIIKKIDRTEFKEHFYSFLPCVGNKEIILNDFWNKNKRKIKQWYLEQKADDDVVISASPRFLLEPICKELGIRLIASEVDFSTGKTKGKNCRGIEKVERFRREFPGAVIDKFYSDSKSDVPMMDISKESFLVKGKKFSIGDSN